MDLESDFFYFDSMIQKYQEDLSLSLMEKRQDCLNSDPLEELKEVYEEVKDMESNFKKMLDVCGK